MARLDKQSKKRADLEMLSTLLQMSQMYGPEQETRELLGEESLREAQLRNQGMEAGLPFLGREHEARIGTQEDERGYARERHPLAMQGMQAQVQGQGIENLFNEQTMDPRRQLMETQAASAAELRAPILGEAQQRVQQGAESFPLEQEDRRNRNAYNALKLQQAGPEFEKSQRYTDIQSAQGLLNIDQMRGGQGDPMAWLESQGVPRMPAQVSSNPAMSDAQLFAELRKRGLKAVKEFQ